MRTKAAKHPSAEKPLPKNGWRRDFHKNKYIYFMALPVFLYYLVFHYFPMYGLLIAFKEYSPNLGILGSRFVGIQNFKDFLSSMNFIRTLTNTLSINIKSLIFGFPAPSLLALLLNEIRCTGFKRVVQTISYLPHFISVMVICGMILDFTASDGLIGDILFVLTGERQNIMLNADVFQGLYVGTDIWQSIGWGSIIYLAALAGVDQQLYEAAVIDGASRWKQTLHVTIPGIMPTIIIMLILRIGQMMNLGFEKIMLLSNETIMAKADVISYYTYRVGLSGGDYSYGTAVGLFNSLINCILLVAANSFSRRVSDAHLW